MYVKLHKVLTEDDADRQVQKMGWKDNLHFQNGVGNSLVNYWIDGELEASPPDDAVEGSIKPICIIVHGRLFPEKATALVKGNEAWIEEEKFFNLF